jgi:hypothetical protein
MRIKTLSVLGLMCGLAAPAVSLAAVDISGFLTFAGTYGSNDGDVSYYNEMANTDHPDFGTRMNHVGVQFYSALTDKVSATIALTAEGGQYNYEVTPEWAYGTYQFNQDWSLRMGRYKGPFYMVSDYRDVGYAYPWVRPPEEVYSTNPIKSINGLDLVFQKTVSDVSYLLEIYGGSGQNTALAPAIYGLTDPVEFETHNNIGFNAVIGTDAISFRVGYYSTDVHVPSFGIDEESGTFAGLGLIVDWRNIVLYSEYVARNTDDTPALSQAFPDQNAWYVTLGYRFSTILPYVTYAKIDEGADPSMFALKQTSTALGLRWDFDDAADIKFEVKQADPDVTPAFGKMGLFDNVMTDKGTIYTITFDTIF